MKINLYLIMMLLVSTITFSQVGIKTESPQGVFHIDAAGSASDQGSVIVTDAGNFGIGVINPQEKLEVGDNMLVTGVDSIQGNLTANKNIIVNDTLRLKGNYTGVKILDNLKSELEIISDTEKGAFKFNDGSQIVNDQLGYQNMIPVLTKDPTSNLVSWVNLPKVTQVKSGTLGTGIRINNNGGGDVNITTKTITLEPGLWLILASASTDGGNGASAYTGGFNVWMHLNNITSGTTVAAIGYPTETPVTGQPAGSGVSTPMLVYPLYVTTTAEYGIGLSTSITNSLTYKTANYIGGFYFYALKLDYTN